MDTLREFITDFFAMLKNTSGTLFGKYTISLWDIVFYGLILGIVAYVVSGFFGNE